MSRENCPDPSETLYFHISFLRQCHSEVKVTKIGDTAGEVVEDEGSQGDLRPS